MRSSLIALLFAAAYFENLSMLTSYSARLNSYPYRTPKHKQWHVCYNAMDCYVALALAWLFTDVFGTLAHSLQAAETIVL